MDLMGQAFDAASLNMAYRLEQLSDDLEALTPKLEAAVAEYNRQATKCRAGS